MFNISVETELPLVLPYEIDVIYVDSPLLITIARKEVEPLLFYRSNVSGEVYKRRRISDELFDKVIIKNMIGGKIIMARKIQNPSKLQPLQMDTAILVPKTVLPGLIGNTKNMVGTKLSEAISLARISYGIPMPTGTYRFEAVGTSENIKYTVTNLETGFKSAEIPVSATANTTLIPGVAVTISSLTGVVAGDYADVDVFGDTTFIVPGTVLGRLKTGPNKGKYEVAVDTNIANYDVVRISAGTLETDPDKRRIGSDGSNILVNSDTLTVSVYVYAQLDKAVCQSVNMTEALENKIQGIVWD